MNERHKHHILKLTDKGENKFITINNDLKWSLSAFNVLQEITDWSNDCEMLNYYLEDGIHDPVERETLSVGVIDYADTIIRFFKFKASNQVFIHLRTDRNDDGCIFLSKEDNISKLPCVYLLADEEIYDNIYDFKRITDDIGNTPDISDSDLVILDFTY